MSMRWVCVTVLAWVTAGPAHGLEVFYSETPLDPDSNRNPDIVISDPTVEKALPIYIDTLDGQGNVASEGGPDDPCSSEESTGDYVCGWHLEFSVTGTVKICGFTAPEDAADGYVRTYSPDDGRTLRVTGGNPLDPEIGLVNIGTLKIRATGDSASGRVEVGPNSHYVWTNLEIKSVKDVPTILTNICAPGDRDCDGIPDASDNCPYFASENQADRNGDGRGDVCQCSDQNGDHFVNVNDLLPIRDAVYTPALVTPLCDGNNDGFCNVNDLIAANIEIYSPTNTSTCARYPVPGP